MKTLLLTLIFATLTYKSLSQDNVCEGHFGEVIPDPDKCYGFIHCVLSTPNYYECSTGEIFSEQEGRCVFGDRETCIVDLLREICRDVFFGARPHPYDETGKLYVGCIMGEPEVKSCFENEIFSPEINECIIGQITSTTVSTTLSSTLTSTETTITETTTSTESTTSPITESTTSTITESTTISLTDSTTSSITESTSTSTETTSTSTESTSTEITSTTQDITTTEQVTTTTEQVTTTTLPPNPCQGLPDGTFLPHEDDCTKYYICLNNIPMELPCQPGEIFPPGQTQCIPGNPNEC